MPKVKEVEVLLPPPREEELIVPLDVCSVAEDFAFDTFLNSPTVKHRTFPSQVCTHKCNKYDLDLDTHPGLYASLFPLSVKKLLLQLASDDPDTNLDLQRYPSVCGHIVQLKADFDEMNKIGLGSVSHVGMDDMDRHLVSVIDNHTPEDLQDGQSLVQLCNGLLQKHGFHDRVVMLECPAKDSQSIEYEEVNMDIPPQQYCTAACSLVDTLQYSIKTDRIRETLFICEPDIVPKTAFNYPETDVFRTIVDVKNDTHVISPVRVLLCDFLANLDLEKKRKKQTSGMFFHFYQNN